ADGVVERPGGTPLPLRERPGPLDPGQLAGRAPLEDVLPLTARLERTFGERARRLPADTRTLPLGAAAETPGGPGRRAGGRGAPPPPPAPSCWSRPPSPPATRRPCSGPAPASASTPAPSTGPRPPGWSGPASGVGSAPPPRA